MFRQKFCQLNGLELEQPSLVWNIDYSGGKYWRSSTGAQRSKSSSINRLNKKVHFTVVSLSSGRRSDRRHVLNVVSGFIWSSAQVFFYFPWTLELELLILFRICLRTVWYNKIGRYCLFCFLDFGFFWIFLMWFQSLMGFFLDVEISSFSHFFGGFVSSWWYY
jgi:hypothetical protein